MIKLSGKEYKSDWQNFQLACYYKKSSGWTFSRKKTLLVWLHPFALDSNVWAYQQPYVPRYVDQLAIDFPGHGQTEGELNKPISGQELTSAIDSVIQKYSFHKIIFIGNSLGGAVALNLAAKYKEKCDGVLVCSPFHPEAFSYRKFRRSIPRALRFIRRHPFFSGLFSKIPIRGKAIEFLFKFSPEKSLVAIEREGYREKLVGYYSKQANRKNFIYLLPALANWPGYNQSLAEIDCPVQIFWGEQDQTLPVESASIFSHRIKNCAVRILSGIGHTPQLEIPAVISAGVRQLFTH